MRLSILPLMWWLDLLTMWHLYAVTFTMLPIFLLRVLGLSVEAMGVIFSLAAAGGLVYNITQVTFRQRITPARLLGRMNASIRFCVWGIMPLAALLAGGLGTWLGVVPTMWIGALGGLSSAAFVVFGPFWRTRALPDAHADAAISG